MDLQIKYDKQRGILMLHYGQLTYHIGLPELGGITLTELSNLKPQTCPAQHKALLICEAATMVRLAKNSNKQTVPEPVNTCSHKLFSSLDADTLKVTRKVQ